MSGLGGEVREAGLAPAVEARVVKPSGCDVDGGSKRSLLGDQFNYPIDG